ncbi:lipid asymmetry maintenance protein MlaB [Marinobacter sp. Arc7-DN-1]|jgi:phospholipid transport system transporter-binding protein|uniref:STAS domain-containing protein n=1 Tax=Marinobacter sp. Arc7-DN-1 TaxID=2304594 RepID=UPI000E4303F9|nr:STAS domain-containing protein [Marinobacter sp. Arc7-DN-1]AXS82578.1 STAS domain-containing protein [Marinobacter sp. Arc7-DN-1]
MTSGAPRVELADGVLIVTGEVSADTVVALRNQGEKLIGTASGNLVVDLDGLVTAHSVVLSMLLCWQRLAHQAGISLSFRGVSGRLVSLAALSNLEDQLAGFGPESAHPAH